MAETEPWSKPALARRSLDSRRGARRVSPRRPGWETRLVLAAALAYASFLAYVELAGTGGGELDPARMPARPAVQLPAPLEWAVFFTTVAWFFVAAADRRRA